MDTAKQKLYCPLSIKEKCANFLARFVLPFKRFKATFKSSDIKGKIALICSFIVPGSGNIILGEIEAGLFYLISSALYFIYLFTVGWKQFLGIIQLDYINLLAFAIIVTFIYLIIYYLSLKSIERNVAFRNTGKKLRGSYIIRFVLFIARKVASFFSAYRKIYRLSDKKHRRRLIISYVIMGFDQLFNHQYLKGLLFLICELGYVAYMVLAGGGHLVGLFTLHVINQVSTASLVYGILSILITLFFVYLYIANLATVRANNEIRLSGKLVPTVKDEISNINNKKFYLVSLSLPVAGAIAFTIIPLLFMILIAFTDYGTSGTIPIMNIRWINWTFFNSFVQLFGYADNLQTLVNVFQWTMIWAILATFTCYFGGFFLAMLLSKKNVKPKILYRSLFVVAMAVPQFVTLRVMNTMFNEYGPINTILMNWGFITERIAFWDNANLAKTLIIFVNMWVGIPFYMLLISGLLLNIPKDYYEAASIEGASKGQQFRKITFPHIFFMTTPLLITSFVSNINNFNVIWLLTGGGPLGQGTGGVAGSTDILITWLYKLTMQNNPEYNLGAAIGIIMFIISAIISLLIFRNSSAYKREEEFRQ